MSKIPQGEWDAIAARYAQGESISRIAQIYGCTPPAIHYILKRNRLRAQQNSGRPLNGRPGSATTRETLQAPVAPALSPVAERCREQAGRFGSTRSGTGVSMAPTARFQAGRDAALAARQIAQAQVPQPAAHQRPDTPRKGRASALTAGLDDELHGCAEAAIEAFRSSFDAALVEGSASVRERLRQAASDLMRVAARTTIVLDRLNASAERAPASAQD